MSVFSSNLSSFFSNGSRLRKRLHFLASLRHVYETLLYHSNFTANQRGHPERQR